MPQLVRHDGFDYHVHAVDAGPHSPTGSPWTPQWP